jgi:4-cresol dehydrogenase (hydroxylating)
VSRRPLQQAIDAWVALLGAEHVEVSGHALRAAGTATFETSAEVHAVLRPGTREEVQGCVRIARRFGVPVTPISTGRNWGYGSSAPAASSVLLNLSRLNQILDYDDELAYVTIEPGVTQRQLHAFLLERGGKLWMDATGASPDCSVIGNTLERGFGHTPMGDHASSSSPTSES